VPPVPLIDEALNIRGAHVVHRDVEFSEYVAARGMSLERFAYVLTGDAHLAQDLVQTALLKAYRRWRWVARADHPDAYVRRIVTRSYLDWRRRRSNAEEPVDVVPDQPAPDLADGVAERDRLHRALGTLSPKQRAVLVLRHYEGLDDAAIAVLLRCGEGSVRSHASRGLARLRASLDQTTSPGGSR
jgi:RNA polymerase sigma-70 factor (sigma-E family)